MVIYRFFQYVFLFIFYTIFRVKYIGLDNIPKDGPVILCSNHISNWDPPAIGIAANRRVYFMAKEELFRIPVFNWIIAALGAFPVKRGGVSKQSIRNALNLLSNNSILGVFPEGSRHASGMAKKGAASLALRSGAAVIPVAIIGNYKIFGRLKVIYGTKIDLSDFQDDTSPDRLEQATEKIMAHIQDLLQKN